MRHETAPRVVAPIFVVGLPRSGTSLLHALLTADRRAQYIAAWEGAGASTPEHYKQAIAGIPGEISDILMLSADLPAECNTLTLPIYRSADFFMAAYEPDYARWYVEDSHAETYAYHRKVLQSRGSSHWVLKSPAHVLHLDALLREYPDARLVHITRDRAECMGSTISMVRRYWERNSPEHLDVAVDEMKFVWGHARTPDAAVHVKYTDMIADPLGTLAQIYRALDLDLLPDTIARASAVLTTYQGVGHGKHIYAKVN